MKKLEGSNLPAVDTKPETAKKVSLELKENKHISPKLVLSEKIQAQIMYTHTLVPKNIEFCGALVYKITNGSIKDIENIELEAIGFFPLDVGSSGYTAADLGSVQTDVYGDYPELLECIDPEKDPVRIGLIHTHHSMDSYFSSVDNSELENNTPQNKLYLSVIVNYAGKYCAKLCINKTKTITEEIITLDEDDKEIIENVSYSKSFIETYTCRIFVRNSSNKFSERLAELIEDSKSPAYVHKQFDGFAGFGSGNFFNEGNKYNNKKGKTWTKEDTKNKLDYADYLIKILSLSTKVERKEVNLRKVLTDIVEMDNTPDQDIFEALYEEHMITMFEELFGGQGVTYTHLMACKLLKFFENNPIVEHNKKLSIIENIIIEWNSIIGEFKTRKDKMLKKH